ncbi:MAG TPA: rhomboid family intramembrane serine protease [Candidatus Hydrogenedentes bacterium]|nr:rhomboid family intramembrane serine protease [Candidatus Hydrogenedentota bacterium]
MRKFNYAYDSNVILDRCPSCSGIWADGGEIYRLASYNKGHPKLDALGASIVEHENERARFQEMVEGASGAVAGVMGAYFVLYPSASIKTLVIYRVMDIPAFIYIGAWLLVQLVSGLLFAGADLQSGVAWFAHIGGFICGAGLAWPAKRAVRRHEKIA